MTGALLHFEKGVPIGDLAIRKEQKESMMRVQHVYWQWVRNPFSIDPRELFRQLVKGKYQGTGAECNAINRDMLLFNFVKESVSQVSRKDAEIKVKAAAEKMMRIGMETDNVTALDKGSKRMFELAGLDKPEEERIDMSKMAFLPPIVTTSVKEVDETKQDVDDQEMKRIMAQYNGFVDEKERDIEKMVETMRARSGDAALEAQPTDESEPAAYYGTIITTDE